MRLKGSLAGDSVYKSFLLSYMLFVVIFILFVISIFWIDKKIIENEIIQTNTAIANTVKTSVDDVMNTIDALSADLFMTPEVLELSKKENIKDAQWEIYQLSKIVEKNHSLYSYVENIGIYFEKSQYIVGSNVSSEARFMYKNYPVSNRNINGFEDWKDFMKVYQAKKLYRSDGDLLYAQSVPDLREGETVVIMIRIKNEQFQKIVGNSGITETGCFFIQNKENEVLAASSEDVFDFNHLPPFEEGLQHINYQKRHLTVFQVSSQSSRLKYVYAIDNRLFYRPLYQAFEILILVVLVLISVSIYLSIFYTKKHYKPLQKILRLIKPERKSGRNANEFQIIENTFRNMQARTDHLINQYNHYVFNNLFVQSLQSKNMNRIYELFQQYHIDFCYQNYIAANVFINDISGWLQDGEDTDVEKETFLIQTAIENIIAELLGSQYHCLTFKVNTFTLFTMIGTQNAEKESVWSDVRNSVSRLKNFAENTMKLKMSMVVSDIFDDFNDVPAVFKTISDIGAFNDYRTQEIIYYSDVEMKHTLYHLSDLQEERIVNNIRNDNFEQAKALLKEYMEQFTMSPGSSPETLEFLKYTVCSLFAKVQQYADDNLDLQELFNMEMSCGAMQEFTDLTMSYLNRLCGVFGSGKSEDKNKILVEKIQDYIACHLGDEDLNVNLLGSVFDLAPNYLSKIFKFQTGVLLKDYINNLRIEEAKKLLKNTDNKMVDIGKSVGFAELTTFNRVFKKYTGISPGQYRHIEDGH